MSDAANHLTTAMDLIRRGTAWARTPTTRGAWLSPTYRRTSDYEWTSSVVALLIGVPS